MKWNRIVAATLLGFATEVPCAEIQDFSSPLALSDLKWDFITTLQAGYGYKDNVFLAHDQPQGSGFASASAEIMALYFPSPGTELNLMASGETRQFLNLNPVYGEYEAFALAALEHQISTKLKLTANLSYLYSDEIQDVSVSQTNRQALPAQGHTITAQPGLRYFITTGTWISFEPAGTRQLYAPPLDDYWQAGPSFSLGRSYGTKSEISLNYAPSWILYDNEPAYNSAGEPIPGTTREDFQHDLRLRWKHSLGADNRWRTVFTLGGRLYDDLVGDYFDYTRFMASGRLEYRNGPWLIAASARAAHYWYGSQTVSDTDPAKRKRTELSAGALLERELWQKLTFVLKYDYERTLSNDEWETYTVNTVSGSLRWEF